MVHGDRRLRAQANTNSQKEPRSMTQDDVLTAFTTTLRDRNGDESITLTMETKRETVPGWDSLNYINFITAVEMDFGVKFKVAEVESFENVGAIVNQTKKLLGE